MLHPAHYSSAVQLLALVCVAALGVAACGDEGPVRSTKPTEAAVGLPREEAAAWIADPNAELGSRAIRRLSVRELRNSYRVLTGEVPGGLDSLPKDTLGHTFDRVVDSQSISSVHLDAFAKVAEEVATSLVVNGTLNRLAPSCRAEILPPLAPSQKTRIIGSSLGALAHQAVKVHPTDPTRIVSELWGDPTASYTHHFEVPGTYQATLHLEIPGRPIDTLNVFANGQLIFSTANMRGPTAVVFPMQVDNAGDTVVRFEFDTLPLDNTLTFEYVGLDLEGPLDLGGTSDARQACATELVDSFAPRAYRRPLSAVQRQTLLDTYDAGVRNGDPGLGLTALIQAILTSPYFLYLVEVGTPVSGLPGVRRLDSFEVAARLSYALCEQPPDETLVLAAQSAGLETVAQVEAHARRLLELPCAKDTIAHFFEQWLWLDQLSQLKKDSELFPEFNPQVAAGMKSEVNRFIHELLWTEDGSLQTLFTSRRVWPDPRSAFLYGWENVTSPNEMTLPEARAGLLMHPGVLAVSSGSRESSPVLRGVYLLEQVLCSELPDPPADLVIPPLPPDPAGTTRQRLTEHTRNESCRGCHSLIDPVGFLLEEFDALGRHRTTEHGAPVDATGSIPSLGIEANSLSGGIDLIEALAAAPQTTDCFSRQWLRFVLGRTLDEGDENEVLKMAATLKDRSLREAFVQSFASPAFLHRRERRTHEP